MNFGKPVLILAIDLRIKVMLVELKKSRKHDMYVQKAIAIVCAYFRKNNIPHKQIPFRLEIHSDLPQSDSFGYSSALYTALIASLLAFYSQKTHSLETINSLTYQLEKKLHKKLYGIRTSASTFGGLLYFRKEFDFLRTISLLQIKIPKNIEQSLSIDIELRDSSQIQQIEERIGINYNTNASFMEHLLTVLEKITKRMVLSFVKEDSELFEDCVKKEKEMIQKLCPKKIQTRRKKYISYRQALKGIVPVNI